MNANAKLMARRRAREARANANAARFRRDRANADDAATVRAMLHRVGAIDAWESKRLDQARQHVRADAEAKRAGHYAGVQAAVDRMRHRGQTLAAIASLVGVDVREIRTAMRGGRPGGNKKRDAPSAPGSASTWSRDHEGAVNTNGAAAPTDAADRRSSVHGGAGDQDWPRCVRCDALMLDADDAPRRGRRRLYCSDTCRRDASAARVAAERHGSPIRVVEVPRAGSFAQQTVESAEPPVSAPCTALDAADITLHDEEALRVLLARVAERARLKDLDRATLTAARELAKVVYPLRS